MLNNLIARGNTADIYLENNKLYKVFKDNTRESAALYEAHTQEKIYQSGIIVPKIYEVTEIDNKQTIVMEYVEGETLGDLLFKDITNSKRYLEISIQEQLKIHNIVNVEIDLMKNKLINQIKNAKDINQNIKKILFQQISKIVWKHNLCHGDYHVYNIIKNKGNFVIIDWVDASVGNVGADVYRSYLLYLTISQELATNYIDLYCYYSGLTKDEIFIWAPIIAGARLSENISNNEREGLLKIINQNLKQI